MDPVIRQIPSEEIPSLMAIIAQTLLERAGGQVVLTQDELVRVQHEYLGTRMAYDHEAGLLTLTLRSTDAMNDRPVGQ